MPDISIYIVAFVGGICFALTRKTLKELGYFDKKNETSPMTEESFEEKNVPIENLSFPMTMEKLEIINNFADLIQMCSFVYIFETFPLDESFPYPPVLTYCLVSPCKTFRNDSTSGN